MSQVEVDSYLNVGYISAPITLHGEGSYAISDVKEIKVTEEYLGLSEDVKECQTKEPYQNCTTRQFLQNAIGKCNCIPYGVKNLLGTNVVCIQSSLFSTRQ